MTDDQFGDSLFPGAQRARSYGEESPRPTPAEPAQAAPVELAQAAPVELAPAVAKPLPPPPAVPAPAVRPVAGQQEGQTGKGRRDRDRGRLVDVSAGGATSATWGWRGRINRWTRGTFRLPATGEEQRYRAGRVRVLRTFDAPQQVVVANPKGGAGKTPVTLGLASTLGWYRGGYTLAWDNNETRGTLGLRAEEAAHDRNVVDLLASIDAFMHARASVGGLGGFVRPQSAHFDVLASDDVPGRMDVIDGSSFHKLADVLGRFYRFIVIDTGNNVRAANWWAATSAADCLVVPTTVRADVAETGLWMLHHLTRLGRGDLVRNAVAVVTCADRQVDSGLLTAIVDRYREVVREVVVLPFDHRLNAGDRVSYQDLGPVLRRALLMAAVAVVESLAQRRNEGGRRS